MRETLKKGQEISLENTAGVEFKYIILDVLSEDGSSCICYVARKIIKKYKPVNFYGKEITDYESKVVILKEFYPSNISYKYIKSDDIVRKEDGFLWLNLDENVDLNRQYKEYIKSIQQVKEYANDVRINKYLCIDTDIEPLFAQGKNGSVYCENLYCSSSKAWISDQKDVDVNLAQMLQTAIAVMDFLELFHEQFNMGYVDLKPEDILLKYDEFGNVNYSNALFFDFDSNRELDRYYDSEDIRTTKAYEPKFFAKYRRSADKKILINRASENCMYSNVLRNMIKNKTDRDLVINDEILGSNNDTSTEGFALIEESKIKSQLTKKKDILDEREKKIIGDTYYAEKKKYGVIGYSLKIMNAVLSVCFFIHVMLTVCSDEGVDNLFTSKLLIACMLWMLLIAIKAITYKYTVRLSNLQVSNRYYNKIDSRGSYIRNKEYYAFRDGKSRKTTTFQDYSEINLRQQRLRHIWWPILALVVLIGFALGLVYKALPLLFVFGLSAVVIFMWIDYIPSSRIDYVNYARFKALNDKNFYSIHSITENDLANWRIARAVFYEDEYGKTAEFDINDSYYKRLKRNLFTIRKDIIDSGYNDNLLNSMPSFYKYDERQDYVEKNKIKNIDLGFTAIQMKQIYKMAFDRVKNSQLIINIVLAIASFIIILLMIGITSESWMRLLCIKIASYPVVVCTVSSVFLVANILSIMNAEYEEKLSAEMAYKSNFVNVSEINKFTLNEMLQNDIAAGYIKAIDIARGTTQYQGYVMSNVNGEKVVDKENKIAIFMRDNCKNRPLLHYRQITNRRRVAISMLCIFGVLFSTFVWLMKLYWLLIPLIVLCILVYYIWNDRILPIYGRKSLLNQIIKIKK